MGHHQEKIVSLAESLLRDRNLYRAHPPTKEARKKSCALKAACLAALLSASAGALGTHFHYEMKRPINRYERFEIKALVFYLARRESEDEASLEKEVQKALALPSWQDLSALDYKRIRDYLWTRLEG